MGCLNCFRFHGGVVYFEDKANGQFVPASSVLNVNMQFFINKTVV